jgi:hypothetical protein
LKSCQELAASPLPYNTIHYYLLVSLFSFSLSSDDTISRFYTRLAFDWNCASSFFCGCDSISFGSVQPICFGVS